MFEVDPLPLESEFRVQNVRHRMHELSREDLEAFLAEALNLLVRLAHQSNQMRDYIEKMEGKI